MEQGQVDRSRPGRAELHSLPLRDLATALTRNASLLARKEIALVRSEVKEDLRTELRTASGLGVAGVCALCTLNLLLLAVVLALMQAGTMSGWLAALVVAAVVLAIGTVAGLVSWSRRVRHPLDATRRSVQESVRWARDRIG